MRAIVLLGILIVHTCNHFGYYGVTLDPTPIEHYTRASLSSLLVGRCNIVFTTLFGCSFYLILKKPSYPPLKFVWRCLLLIIIGLIAKIFYTFDALMWYGIIGIILVPFRKLNTKALFWSFVLLFISARVISFFKLGTFFFGEALHNRYYQGNTLNEVITYPLIESVKDYFRVVFDKGFIFGALSYMVLGYYLAKSGVIYNLKKYATWRILTIFFSAYIALVAIYLVFSHLDFYIVFRNIVRALLNLAGATTYCLLFLMLYFRFKDKLRWMEKYGKLGLTNYFFQGVIGVILFTTIYVPHHTNFLVILGISFLLYIIQSIFSVVWLKYFKFGPLEGIWRKATNFYS